MIWVIMESKLCACNHFCIALSVSLLLASGVVFLSLCGLIYSFYGQFGSFNVDLKSLNFG